MDTFAYAFLDVIHRIFEDLISFELILRNRQSIEGISAMEQLQSSPYSRNSGISDIFARQSSGSFARGHAMQANAVIRTRPHSRAKDWSPICHRFFYSVESVVRRLALVGPLFIAPASSEN